MKRFSAPPIRLLVPGLILFVAALALLFSYFVVRPYLLALSFDSTHDDIRYSLNRLQGTLEYLLARDDLDGVRREVAANSARRDVRYLLVIDPEHRVLAASSLAQVGKPLSAVGLHVAPGVLDDAISADAVRTQRLELENTLYGIAPLSFPAAGQLRPSRRGAVLMELDLTPHQGMHRIETLFGWVTAAILLLGVLTWYGFERHIRRRLQRITNGLAALEAGDYDRPVILHGNDELAQIAHAMNQLAASLTISRTELLAQNARFDSIMQHIPALVSIVDADGRFSYVNEGFERVYGRDPARTQERLEEVFSADTAARYRALNEQVVREGRPMQLEISTCVKGREHRWFMVKFPLGGANSEPGQVCTVSVDITEKEQNEQLLRISRRIFENTTEGVIITDREGRIVELNNSFARITGYSKEELLGRSPDLLRSTEQDSEFYRTFWRTLNSEGRWQGEITNRRRDGTRYQARLSVSTITDRDGEINGYFAIYQDISAEKRAEESLRELAYYDTLTGLYNRASFKRKVGDALRRVERFNEPFGLLFIDLDRFKEINDSFGHEHGDQLLAQVARRIESELRELDQACRLGGDEFTVLVPHVDGDADLAAIAQRLIDVISRPYRLSEQEMEIGCSIGIVVAPRDGSDADVLMRHADAAMYHAKDSGRGRYAFFDAAIDARNQRLMKIKQGLKFAEARQELSLVYQPEVDPHSGEVRLYEALMRWNSEELGPVSPAEFIAVAEESDLISQLTRWLIEQVARDSRCAPLDRCPISINLSPRQFRSDNWLQLIRAAIEQHALEPGRLCIEVTESALVEDLRVTGAQLEQLKQLGIRVAIDDFGTGYSSLAYLKRLPIDFLKIDRSFVADIGQDPDDQTIVETVIVMAHALGLQVVAEGAETQEQVEFLRSRGCDLIQGYYYARPLPVAQLEPLPGQD
jgi:diguanylate cyclase (GGDEF)-like protein/PAS domain S-box-containing protein